VGGVVVAALIGVGVFFAVQKKPTPKVPPALPPPQPAGSTMRARLHIPPNATLLYSNVPQQLYPVYPLQHIRVLRQ
jgi:hypothetical protein